MALSDVVRNAIKTADGITKPFQVIVKHYAWIETDMKGEFEYDPEYVNRECLSQKKRARQRFEATSEISQVTVLTFLGPIAEHGAAGRQEPIDPRDKIILPDGTTGPLSDIGRRSELQGGLDDPTTNQPYLFQVTIG